MKIYVLKWAPGGNVPKDGAAYTDRERAERHAEYANRHTKWWHRLRGGHWIVSTLDLWEGKIKKYNAK